MIEMSHVRDCKIYVLSKYDHSDESLRIRVLDIIDDISLMVVDRNV